MQGVGDRIIVWTCCLMLAGIGRGITTVIVISALLAFITACNGIYMERKMLRLLLVILYTVASFFYNEFLLFLPVMVYELLNVRWNIFRRRSQKNPITYQEYRKRYACIFAGAAIVLSAYYNMKYFEKMYLIVMVVLTLIAIWLNIYCNKYSDLKLQFIKNRDASVELTLALKNKNKYLIEKQDSEIHLATLSERNRIAREIHDNVGHMLTRSILQMGAVITINKDEELKPFLNGIKETLDMAMTSIRTSVHDLHDEAIDLKEAVRDITKDMKAYDVRIDCDMSKEVPRNVKYCLISVVKEATSNIVKHSNGDMINIAMREHPAFFRLLVEDNGTACRNIDMMAQINSENEGIGLANIKDRVETLKGTLNISTDKGFRIVISIPKS